MGYDSDHPRSLGEVGREGVAIDSLADMETLFEGIPLGEVSTSMTINAPGGDPARVLRLRRREAGRRRATQLRGTIQNDILKEYIAQKEWIFPPEPSMRLVTDMVEFCAREHAAVEHDLDLRLPHPRGGLDRGPGARVHARRRVRLRRGVRSSAGSTSTTSRRACRSSSTRTSTSSRRSRSTAPRGGSGRASCASATGRRTRARWLMRFHTQTAGVLADRAAARDQHRAHGASRRSPRCSAARSRCTRTRWTRRSRCRPRRRSGSRCARSRSSRTRPGVANTIDPLGGSYYVEDADEPARGRGRATTSTEIDALGGVVAGDRAELLPARDRRGGVPLPARGRARSSAIIVGVNRYVARGRAARSRFSAIDPALETEAGRAGRRSARAATRRAVERPLARAEGGRRGART